MLRITGGEVLRPEGLASGDLHIAEGVIVDAATDGRRFDATGLMVLPGIVDLHGDAFERQMQPRPGVDFPIAVALADTEAQLLANGITTAFLAVTLSWEPGLRGLPAWQRLAAGLAARRARCDLRLHLRWEACNLAALEVALADIAGGRVHLLAFNDHTPSILRKITDPVQGAKYSDRAGMTLDAFRDLAATVEARMDEAPAGQARLAAAARAAGLPMASHDDDTPETRVHYRGLGARICEFPMAVPAGEAARDGGDWVVMGSPNVVRGGSHLNWTSAAAMVEVGICNVLSSDYFYPAMRHAAFALAGRGTMDLAAAWALIAANPAAACHLADRGTLAVGQRADVVVLDPGDQHVVATIVAGEMAHLGAGGAARLS